MSIPRHVPGGIELHEHIRELGLVEDALPQRTRRRPFIANLRDDDQRRRVAGARQVHDAAKRGPRDADTGLDRQFAAKWDDEPGKRDESPMLFGRPPLEARTEVWTIVVEISA